jgi:hypothetical protein
MATTDAYEDGSQETRQDFTANDFRITRALRLPPKTFLRECTPCGTF